jgi:hypothetical protein
MTPVIVKSRALQGSGAITNFRIIEEGSSRGGMLSSFLDLIEHGASRFAPERAAALRTALAVKYET